MLKILLEAADRQTGGLWAIPEGSTDPCSLAGWRIRKSTAVRLNGIDGYQRINLPVARKPEVDSNVQIFLYYSSRDYSSREMER
jgi:hypothetical protein